jgi:electron transport complex protein RnfD
MNDRIITVSPSPHVYSDSTVKNLMYGVLIALAPAFAVSVFYFGLNAFLVTLVAVVACVLFEFLIQRFLLKSEVAISDGSAVLTGVLLAFNLPSSVPLWIVVVGAFAAISFGKMTFGGLGRNPFNPALVGRVFLLISFPVDMTYWPTNRFQLMENPDVISGATPLGLIKEGLKAGETLPQLMEKIPTYWDLMVGNLGGSLGEISALALVLGGIFMLARKIITWHIPVSFLGSVIVFAGILWMANPDRFPDPVFHLLSGGIMLGAIFMATDYVTSPMDRTGMLVYGAGCGIITILIRVFGAYPEGVSFAILIMNAFVPLINKGFKPKKFGEEVKNG